jgi:DNA repair exonuclease SbcCD ATPase subunit
MVDNKQLIYPTVDLFLYDLGEGLGELDTEIEQNRRDFFTRIYGEKLDTEILNQIKTVEETAKDYLPLLSHLPDYIQPLKQGDGYYYPVKLGDTYGLQIDCSGEIEKDAQKRLSPKPKPLTSLSEIKTLIKNQLNSDKGTIGQSWFVWGLLTSPEQNSLETAKNCYEQINLFPDSNWERNLKQTGEFLGAHFYELWKPPSHQHQTCDSVHLIICLFDAKDNNSLSDVQDKVELIYPQLMRLFYYRNKVIWSYWQSRQLKIELKNSYPFIQKTADNLPQQVNQPRLNLNQLQKELADILKVLSIYSNQLSSLEEQQSTIKTNLKNYQKRVNTIAELDFNLNSEATRKFLTVFSDYVEKKYLEQTKSDLRSFNSGFKLLENTIKTIEGIISIEHTKNDRDLNVTIGVVGTALAMSGVIASVLSPQPEPPKSHGDFSFLASPAFFLSSLPLLISVIILLYRFFR